LRSCEKWDKTNGIKPGFDKTIVSPFDQGKILLGGADRQDHSSTGGQLPEQRRRQLAAGGGDDDAVEGGCFGHSELAIRVLEADIELPEMTHVGLGLFQERPQALDRVDLGRQLRQDRCLITAAGADFEGPAQRRPPVEQQFDHPRDDEGL